MHLHQRQRPEIVKPIQPPLWRWWLRVGLIGLVLGALTWPLTFLYSFPVYPVLILVSCVLVVASVQPIVSDMRFERQLWWHISTFLVWCSAWLVSLMLAMALLAWS